MLQKFLRAGLCIWTAWSVSAADIEKLLESYRARPNDWQLCQQIGVSYVQEQQLDKALEFFDKAAKLNPQFLPARKNRATVLWFLDRRNESQQEFSKLLASLPNDPTVHFYLGLASHGRGQFLAAKNHFIKAGALATDNPEALPAVVESFAKTNDYAILPKAIQVLRDNESAREQVLQVAEVLLAAGRAAEAIDLLESPARSDGRAAALLAQAYERRNLIDKAYSAYVTAVELSPTDQTYLSLSLFAAEHRNIPFALQIIHRGLTQNPNSPILLMNEGLLLAIDGARAPAEERLRQALAVKPDWNEPVLCLGILQLESSHLSEASDTFRRAIELSPQDARAYYLLATALSRTGDIGHTQEVIALLSKAIRLNPKDARPHVLLGQTYVSMGKLDLALASVEKARRLDPASSSALYQLALLHRRLGKPDLAAKYMTQFQETKARREQSESELVQVLKILKD